MSELAVSARGVTKTFGRGSLAFTALHGVDFHVERGEFVMLAGPSGSGKTTLLSILGCVLTRTSGDVELLGRRVSALPERKLPAVRLAMIGFVFQGHNLLPALSAHDNVAFVLKMKGWRDRDADREASRLLERVDLGDREFVRPAQLSGGQRQRVAIARALAGDPPLVLADEPTAALDAANGLRATELLRDVAAERGGSVVVVTHDNRIFHLADRIVHIEDGRVASEEGAPS